MPRLATPHHFILSDMDFVVPDPSYGVKECEEFFKVYVRRSFA